MSEFPENRAYSKRHVWALANPKKCTASIGLTEFFAENLGEIESIDLPLAGDELEMDSFCVQLHVRNHIRHVRAPLSGRVTEINKEVEDNPNLIHLNPHRNWLFRMEYDDQDELDLLMTAAKYTRFIDRL